MKTHVFLGPSLPLAQAQAALGDLLPEVVFHPPVAMGDVQQLLGAPLPRAVVIIDGFFEQKPAVWHKEILYALSRQVLVYGGSSMGALRAAELHAFGMRGVGAVFEAYRDGLIDADDEVAIAHATSEFDFRPLSDALVNIRYGLELAERAGLIDAAAHQALLKAARAVHFPARSWGRLFDDAGALLSADQVKALAEFIKATKPDRKRADALLVLEQVVADHRAGVKAPPAGFDFEPTKFWEQSAWSTQREAEAPHAATLLNHFRVANARVFEAMQRGLMRKLARAEAIRLRLPEPTQEEFTQTVERFRRERGLRGAAGMRQWLSANQLSDAEFAKLIVEEFQFDLVMKYHAAEITEGLLPTLKSTGLFAGAMAEVTRQEAFFAERGHQEVSLEDAAVDLPTLYEWYAKRVRPFHVAPDEYAHRLGFKSLHLFNLELTRWYYFEKHSGAHEG